ADLLACRFVERVELRLHRRRCRGVAAPSSATTARAAAAAAATRAAGVARPSRSVNDECARRDHFRLTAECRNLRQLHAGEERIARRLLSPPVAVRPPPLLVARGDIERRDSTELLRLHDRDGPDRRRGAGLEAGPAFAARRLVNRRRRQGSEKAAAVVWLAVAMLGARVIFDFDRAQTGLSADVEETSR